MVQDQGSLHTQPPLSHLWQLTAALGHQSAEAHFLPAVVSDCPHLPSPAQYKDLFTNQGLLPRALQGTLFTNYGAENYLGKR